jgi:hypothetical protein
MTTNKYTYTEEERDLDRRAEARADAWMKVMRDATMAQRPHLYSQAVAMFLAPDLVVSRSLRNDASPMDWCHARRCACSNKAGLRYQTPDIW